MPSSSRKKRVSVYTEEDYNSPDGMLTSVWGPLVWNFLHIMSFNYPVSPTKEEKQKYMSFIISLQNVLPCKYCRENLKKNLKRLPITMESMESRETFSRYVYDLHETVNKMLKKKSNLTYDEVRERFEHFRSRCTIPVNTTGGKRKTAKAKNHHASHGHGKKELGCTKSLYGNKAKSVIRIVPQTKKCKTFDVDKTCIKKIKPI